MPYREEQVSATVGATTKSFTVNNRKRVSRLSAEGKSEQVESFMDDVEFEAHKNEQVANMERSIREAQRPRIRITWQEDQTLEPRTQDRDLKRNLTDIELEAIRVKLGAQKIERI